MVSTTKVNFGIEMSTSETLRNEQKEMKTILKLSISASLSALGIVLSVFVVLIPNFEFISMTIFLISLLFGVYYGLLSAISISLIYEFIVTPIYGSAIFLFFFKLFCYLILAIISGISRKQLLTLSSWELGVFGSLFAFFFYVITTVGGEIVIIKENITLYYLLLKLLFGIPFAVIHIIANFILFSLTKKVISWISLAFKARGIKLLMLPTVENFAEKESNPMHVHKEV
ncbi:MAG: hypothetical protein ACTSWZ_04090 [Candidatus Heimdallarchaeaceae archaeon]